MQALTFKENHTNFYIGNLLSKIGNWTVFQAVDSNSFLGSIHIFKNEAINNKNNLSQEEDFYNYLDTSNQIIDPFNFNKENLKITKIKWASLADLLIQVQSFNSIISIESIGNKTYTGRINMITSTSAYLDEQTEEYNLTEIPLKIDYTKIVGVSANSIENKLFNNWLLMENHRNSRVAFRLLR